MKQQLKIAVCVKQVPDTGKIKWTENNTIDRTHMDSVINPCDEYALEMALDIKEAYQDKQTHISVFSMGPNKACDVLKYALALGCDEGYLISDKLFLGSDSYITSKILAQAIKFVYNDDFDIVICGQFAQDGDTAQTGPGIAINLDIPVVTYVSSLIEANDESVVVQQNFDDSFNIIKMPLKSLICVINNNCKLRNPSVLGYMLSQKKDIKIITANDLGFEKNQVGLKGSPTYVYNAYRFNGDNNREKKIYNDLSSNDNAKIILKEVQKLFDYYED